MSNPPMRALHGGRAVPCPRERARRTPAVSYRRFDERVQLELSLWRVTAATTTAAVAMGIYLWNTHPELHKGMHEPDEQARTW